jgi:hypothetical protein
LKAPKSIKKKNDLFKIFSTPERPRQFYEGPTTNLIVKNQPDPNFMIGLGYENPGYV